MLGLIFQDEQRSGYKKTWIQVLAPPLAGCRSPGELLKFSVLYCEAGNLTARGT